MLSVAAGIVRRVSTINFFTRESVLDSTWDIVWWWEVRRFAFNFIIGITGIIAGMVCLGIYFIWEYVAKQPTVMPDPPLFVMFAVVLYGILANVCYTGGWLAELIALRVWKDKASSFGEIAFSLGLTFSIFLTLSPIFFITLQMLLLMIFPELHQTSVE